MSKITLKLGQYLHQNHEAPILKAADSERWYSGGELAADVDQLTDQLRGLGVGHGNVVLISLPNLPVYPVLLQAIWNLGAIALPVALQAPDALIQTLSSQAHVAAAVVLADRRDAVITATSTVMRLQLNTVRELTLVRDPKVSGRIPATPTKDDAALLLASPRAAYRVAVTHQELWTGAKRAQVSYQLTPTDRTLLATAFNFSDAQFTLLAAQLAGSQVVLTTTLMPSQFWPQIIDNQITWVSLGSARMVQLLQTMTTDTVGSSLRLIHGLTTGGSPGHLSRSTNQHRTKILVDQGQWAAMTLARSG